MKFIYEAYAQMLGNLQSHGYHIVGYDNWDDYEKCVILRHDIDNSLKKALIA